MLNNHKISIPPFQSMDGISALALLLLTVLLQPHIALFREIPLDSDSILFFYPLRALHSQENLGFWNPYLFCGFPRDANPQSQLLYPPNLIFQLVSTQTGFAILLIGHLWIGACLMYLLLRSGGLKWKTALFGAAVFLASTFWQCKITNLGLLEGIAWFPGILICTFCANENRSYRMAAVGSIFLSLLMLAGVPHTFVYCEILLLCITLSYGYIQKNWKFLFCSYILMNLLAVGITAGMWLPAYYYSYETQRVQIPLQDALAGSLPWVDLWKAFFGGLAQPGIQRSDPWEGTCYIGITALLFVALGWKQFAKPVRTGLLAAFIFALFCTAGSQGLLFSLLYFSIPGWSFLNLPNRSLLLCAIILPIFSAYGLHGFLKQKAITAQQKQTVLTATAVLLLSACIWMMINPWAFTLLRYSALTTTFQPNSLSEESWAGFNFCFWAGMTGVCLTLYIYKYMREWVLLICLFLLVLFQSMQYSQRLFLQTVNLKPLLLNNTLDSDTKRVVAFSPLIDIESDVRSKQIYLFGMYRMPEVYGWHEIQGYDPMYPKRYSELIRAWSGIPQNSDPTRIIRLHEISKPMLDFFHVDALIGFPKQKLIYAGNTVLSEPQVIYAKLSEPDKLKKISFRWLLTNAFQTPNKMEIGKVRIHNGSETLEEFPILTGENIANYITMMDGQRARHREADVYRWFPLPSMRGYTKVNQYSAVYDINSQEIVDSISVELSISNLQLVILQMNAVMDDDMGLHFAPPDEIAPLFENSNTSYPAYITNRISTHENVNQFVNELKLKPEFINKTVWLDSEPDLDIPNESISAFIKMFKRENSDQFMIETSSNQNALLVLSENYSSNWKASVDEQPVPVIRANYSFMAVPIPSDAHTITLQYIPTTFYIGCGIGCISLLIALWLIVVPPLFNRQD